jgi:hypothetical protein
MIKVGQFRVSNPIPSQGDILASQWREIKDEMGRNARLEILPGGLGSGPRALRRGADRRGLEGRVSRLGAGAPSWYGRDNPVRCTGTKPGKRSIRGGLIRKSRKWPGLAGRSAFYR